MTDSPPDSKRPTSSRAHINLSTQMKAEMKEEMLRKGLSRSALIKVAWSEYMERRRKKK